MACMLMVWIELSPVLLQGDPPLPLPVTFTHLAHEKVQTTGAYICGSKYIIAVCISSSCSLHRDDCAESHME